MTATARIRKPAPPWLLMQLATHVNNLSLLGYPEHRDPESLAGKTWDSIVAALPACVFPGCEAHFDRTLVDQADGEFPGVTSGWVWQHKATDWRIQPHEHHLVEQPRVGDRIFEVVLLLGKVDLDELAWAPLEA